MFEKKFEEAEPHFRKALDEREAFAEAHNNLAYVLRKQGTEFYEEALRHYTRAIEIKPDLAQPYMYRGVLFVQMGNVDAARQDHQKLETLDNKLAEELKYVIETGSEKAPEQFFGVSPQL